MGFDVERDSGSPAMRVLNRAKLKVVKQLQRAFAIEDPKQYGVDGRADPLVDCCTRELRKTRHGRVGLYLVQMRPPAFSMALLKPKNFIDKFESQYQEAGDTYSDFEIPGLVFEHQGHFFVYTGVGSVDEKSVLVVRNGRQARFVYSLHGFLHALGVIEDSE